MIYSVVQSSPHIPPCLSTRYPPLIHPISPLSDPHNKNVPSLLSGNGTNNQSVQQALSALRLPRGAFSSSMAHRCLYGRWRFCSRFIPRKRMQNRIGGRSSDLSSRPFPASFIECQWVSVVRITLCANALCGTSGSGTYSSGSVTVSHRIPFSISVLRLIPTILSMSNGFGICGAS